MRPQSALSVLLSFIACIRGQDPSASNSISTALTGAPIPSQSEAVQIPNCIQPRSATDPAATEISATLKPAVSNACDVSQQKQARSDDGSQTILSFQTGQMFFNITNPVGVVNVPVVPPSSCHDHFNAIISACIDPNGNSWGGWKISYGTNWSISNIAFPANGLLGAAIRPTGSSGLETSTRDGVGSSAITSGDPSSTTIITDGTATGAPSGSILTGVGSPLITDTGIPPPTADTGTLLEPSGSGSSPVTTNTAPLPVDTGTLFESSGSGISLVNTNTAPLPADTGTLLESSGSGIPPISTNTGAPPPSTSSGISFSSKTVFASTTVPPSPGSSVTQIGPTSTTNSDTPITSASGSPSIITSELTRSVLNAFSGTNAVTSFPVSGGGILQYTRSTFRDLATITKQTTITTDVIETRIDGGIFTYHGPIVVGPGGTFWGPPGINIPLPPGGSAPCIWPFCTGGGNGGGSGGEPGSEPNDPHDSNEPSETDKPTSTRESSRSQSSSSSSSRCSSQTVTDFFVSCSTSAATVSCSTYSTSIIQGCTVTATTETTAAACSKGGGGYLDDPIPSGWADNGPDYPTPVWSEFMAMQTVQSDYYQYKGPIVSGDPVPSTGSSAIPRSSTTAKGVSSTTTADASSTGSSTEPEPTQSSPICIPFQDPHMGISACNCESGTITTRLPMRTGSSDFCGYTILPSPSPTPKPSTTSAPEWPFTFTDINEGHIIACKSSMIGNAGGIGYTACEGDRTTVGTDTEIAAHHSSFVASVSSAEAASSAAASPTADCTIYDSGLAYSFLIEHINGWAGEDGGKLKHEEKGCGALTGWKWDGDSAEFHLPFFIKEGCVERAIKTAGGPHLSCRGGGIGKRDGLAGSLKPRRYKKRQDLASADNVEATRQRADKRLHQYEKEMIENNYRRKDGGNRKTEAVAQTYAQKNQDPRDITLPEQSIQQRGNVPSTIVNFFWPPPPAPPPGPGDLPVEWWEKATIPGVDQCNDNIRRKNQVGKRKSVFYTGLGEHGYESLKIWLQRNQCIQGPFVHWNNIVVQMWMYEISGWIGRPYVKMKVEDAVPMRVNDMFLNHLSQAFGEMSGQDDAYLFMLVGGGNWNEDSAWGAFEYPALTRNQNIQRIWRIDLDLSDPANPTNPDPPKIIWDRSRGDGESPNPPKGIRERSNPEMSPLTYVSPIRWSTK